MAKKKTKEEDVNVEEKAIETTEAPEVKEVDPPLKLKNPYLTITVEIHGLEPKSWTGIRGPIAKSARAWIRARGLSVDTNKVPGVIKEEAENAGQTYTDSEGQTFETDLITYRFTAEAIAEADLAVVVPQERAKKDAPKAKDKPEAKELAEAPSAAEVTETATPDAW